MEKTPWGIVLLLGGGYTMAKAAKDSGLSEWLGTQMKVFGGLPVPLMVLIVCIMTSALTEMSSNVATASIILPVLKDMVILYRF